jgi:HD-GYP domain-containing protein (c-di-GMP phosphodiesterase class II)
MPRGSVVSVSIAPIVAAMILGGPVAAGWVAAIGTTELREVRGEVPWYGTLVNHCVLILPAIAGGLITAPAATSGIGVLTFALAMLGATVYYLANVALASIGVSIVHNEDFRVVVVGDTKAHLPNLFALAPLAWLMAQVYLVLGVSATLLFGLPLYMQRLANHRLVEMREMFTQTIEALAGAVDKRDPFTGGHSRRVKDIAVAIGREMRVSEGELEALEWGGLLHDIGKIGIGDAVLKKADRLTRDERIEMNAHPVKGAEIIAPVTRLAPELPVIRHHHEWYNGSGYPDRLMGDEIPKLARILHVADAFEAMTAARPYRMTPLSAEQALGELRKFAGIQFDPRVVDAFVRTEYVEGVPDAGRDAPPPKPVPLLGEVAAARASDEATRLAGTLTPDPV